MSFFKSQGWARLYRQSPSSPISSSTSALTHLWCCSCRMLCGVVFVVCLCVWPVSLLTGLGKTLQTIAFLAHLKFDLGIDGPHLVVAPLSVLSSWMTELKRFCPKLRAVKLHSADMEERKRLMQVGPYLMWMYISYVYVYLYTCIYTHIKRFCPKLRAVKLHSADMEERKRLMQVVP